MSEQPQNAERAQPDVTGREHAGLISDVVKQLVSAADVEAAFGDPRTIGDRTIILAAEVSCGVGFGLGGGQGRGPEEDGSGGGAGAGAGGGARSRPVAAIIIEPQGVSVQPIVDVTQIGLAALSFGVFTFFALKRRWRRAVRMAS